MNPPTYTSLRGGRLLGEHVKTVYFNSIKLLLVLPLYATQIKKGLDTKAKCQPFYAVTLESYPASANFKLSFAAFIIWMSPKS
jgi:hypothetical protein